MSLFDEAIEEFKAQLIDELEKRVWERLEPRIQRELYMRHLSIRDVAQYLHVSEQTIRRMVHGGELPAFRIRNQLFVRQTDIDAWIEQQIEHSKHS